MPSLKISSPHRRWRPLRELFARLLRGVIAVILAVFTWAARRLDYARPFRPQACSSSPQHCVHEVDSSNRISNYCSHKNMLGEARASGLRWTCMHAIALQFNASTLTQHDMMSCSIMLRIAEAPTLFNAPAGALRVCGPRQRRRQPSPVRVTDAQQCSNGAMRSCAERAGSKAAGIIAAVSGTMSARRSGVVATGRMAAYTARLHSRIGGAFETAPGLIEARRQMSSSCRQRICCLQRDYTTETRLVRYFAEARRHLVAVR